MAAAEDQKYGKYTLHMISSQGPANLDPNATPLQRLRLKVRARRGPARGEGELGGCQGDWEFETFPFAFKSIH